MSDEIKELLEGERILKIIMDAEKEDIVVFWGAEFRVAWVFVHIGGGIGYPPSIVNVDIVDLSDPSHVQRPIIFLVIVYSDYTKGTAE